MRTPTPVPAGPLERSALWWRLERWPLDPPGATLSFAAKLARENGWTARQAERVIAEYRRFLFLAMTAGHPVCPSDAVDQAWHQHLLDTRAYWEEFCPRVLGRPLHHSPSLGRPGERQRLGEGYRRTLASYQEAFGEPPPADLWPEEAERFGGGQRWRRVAVRPRLPLVRILLLGVLGLGLGGCAAQGQGLPNPLALGGPEFLVIYGLLSLASLGLVKGLLHGLRQGDSRAMAAPNLSALELAYLAGGPKKALSTALLSLLQGGR